MNLLFALFLIILKAAADGLALNDMKTVAGVIESLWFAGIVLGLYAWTNGIKRFDVTGRYIKVLIGFVLLRFALFDIVLNRCAGLDWNFIGSTKLYDQFWQWFFDWTNFSVGHTFLMLKGIALLIGITLLMSWENGFKRSKI